jgi:tyramine---L-glutamate ligase
VYDYAILNIYHWDDVQNKPIKKIFVCEFITGGGLNHSELTPDLAEQGQLMRDALLKDFLRLPYQILTTVDSRLIRPVHCDDVLVISSANNVWDVWSDVIRTADAVWFIAPETDGCLAKMTALALKYNKVVIGCGLNAIQVFSSKLATYQHLKLAKVATIETYLYQNWNKAVGLSWLAKPDDGAGCEETVCFETAEELERWLLNHDKQDSHVIQPYIPGDAASISCVMHKGRAHLLSCNQQLITMENNTFGYKGCVVNGMCNYWEAFDVLANKIAQSKPDLAGYVGIDVIVNHQGNAECNMIVVEINPRLTTSYVALSEAIGHNPTALIMQTLTEDDYVWPVLNKNKVRLNVSQCHV